MSTEIILITIVLTIMITVTFVIVANFHHRDKDVRELDFKIIATQLLALTIWVLLLTNIFLFNKPDKNHVDLILFTASVIVGVLLIKSTLKHSRSEKTVRKLAERLQKNNEKLKRLDQQKTEFVSIASHQLRGPVAVIHGYTAMMLDGDYGELPEEAKEALRRTLRSSKAMSLLINDYLDVAQIEKGEMEYTIEDVDLVKILEEIAEEFKIISEKARLDFSFSKKVDVNEIILRADKNKLRQVITNVIDNAVKYTKEGSIDIKLDIKEDEAIMTIKDTGIGINPKKTNEIFGKFARADEAIKMNVVGTGLGLFVAKVMIESQDGKIWAESEGIGKGSTFYITMPIAKKD